MAASVTKRPTLKVEDVEWANKLIAVLDEFRKVSQNITANQIVTFLDIALEEGISQAKLEEKTGLHNATISRICAILSDRGLPRRDQEALDLIRIVPVDDDFRAKGQVLSHRGKMMFNGLRAIMKGR